MLHLSADDRTFHLHPPHPSPASAEYLSSLKPISRPMLKRPRDAFDSSPASSTPPERLAKTMKRYHIDSDAFSDASAFHLPSDSPSNPFGRVKPAIPRDLPAPTPVSEHLALRFQLADNHRSVYRVATVPVNYTFWHLHRLTQFLFGWKDFRKEKHPDNKLLRIERRIEHIFTIQKRIVILAVGPHTGFIKSGRSVGHISGSNKKLKRVVKDDLPWEREEGYTLAHVWDRPDNTVNSSRGIIYEHDILSYRKTSVHISIHRDSDKIKSSLKDVEEPSNTPRILLGSGLPDDDDDDEDFALDLQQFNEPHAFENFILSQEDESDDREDDCPSVLRLLNEQAIVRRRMTAPLPKRLPMDEYEDVEQDVPPKVKMLPTKAAAIPAQNHNKERRMSIQGMHFPDPEESREVGVDYPVVRELSPVKKRTEETGVHLPDAEESREIGADYHYVSQTEAAPRKRMPLVPRFIDAEESCEVVADYVKAQRKRASLAPRLSDAEEDYEDHAPEKTAAQHLQQKRKPFEPRLPDPDESVEICADAPPAPRKRMSLAPRLPDPDESREIGDDRPSMPTKHDLHPRRMSLPPFVTLDDVCENMRVVRKPTGPSHHVRHHAPLRGARKRVETSHQVEDDEVDELNESEVEV